MYIPRRKIYKLSF